MKIPLFVFSVIFARSTSADEQQPAKDLKLVARHAEVPDVIVISIESKPMHGQLVLKTWIGDHAYILGPGDVARHQPGVLHTVEAFVESTIIEIKSPPPDITTVVGTGKNP